MPPHSEPFPGSVVAVIDTSVLVEIKRLFDLTELWRIFEHLSTLVASGELAYPKQVTAELAAFQFPDAPGAWATRPRSQQHPAPSDEALAEVLGVAPLLIDPDADLKTESADPYVIAMAWEIKERDSGYEVFVATNDYRDRLPRRQGMGGACDRLGLGWWKPEEFFEWAFSSLDGKPPRRKPQDRREAAAGE